jgi:uncharacterized membrane-anchored protein
MRRTLGILVVSALVFGVLNGLVLDKEWLLARGETVYLELGPTDPRSLIQGDYMRLRYEMADEIREDLPDEHVRGGRVVARLDDDRIAHFERIYRGGDVGEDEMLLRWRFRDRIAIGANAFYFQEGRGDRYREAAYGELKVDSSGETILIGLRDDDLDPLGSRRDATSDDGSKRLERQSPR